MSRGVVYLASGAPYIEEAKTSAKSVKRHNPSLPVTLYTDEDPNMEVFDTVVPIDYPVESWGDSVLTKDHFPYEQNLYLDADTYVCGDITSLFELLETYDLAATCDISRGRYNADFYDHVGDDLPRAFPEYNTGVLLYNNCKKVNKLFEAWSRRYNSQDYDRNQPAFRRILYESDIAFTTLPSEYNFRSDRVGYACGEIKILHHASLNATEAELAKLAEILNAYEGKRVTTWDRHPIRLVPQQHRSMRYRIRSLQKRVQHKLTEDGVASLIETGIKIYLSKLRSVS